MKQKLDRTDRRRLDYLCSILDNGYARISFKERREWLTSKEKINFRVEEAKNERELLGLFEKGEYTQEEAYDHWIDILIDKRARKRENKDHFQKDMRDNKTRIVYRGGGNKNPIRYPKKVRKTAWKRFYKLFPMLKPKEEIK